MTDHELVADSRQSYEAAISAMRLRAVVRGDALPRLEERIDLMLLAKLNLLDPA